MGDLLERGAGLCFIISVILMLGSLGFIGALLVLSMR